MTLLPLLLAALGCAAPADSGDSAPPATIELGAGLSAYTALADGDAVPLVYGLQGGWHIDVALRAWGLPADGARLTYQIVDPVDDAVLSYPTEAILDARRVLEIEGGWERLGDRVIFDVAAAEEVLDRALRVEVELSGPATLSDARDIWVEGRAAR